MPPDAAGSCSGAGTRTEFGSAEGCVSRRGTGGDLNAPDAEVFSLEGAGDWLPLRPSALRALRIVCWCRDSAADSSSFVSINVVRVSSSGGGFVEWMYDCIAREADRHRSENSFMRSLSNTSVTGVDSTNWVRSLAVVFASEIRVASSLCGGNVRPGGYDPAGL